MLKTLLPSALLATILIAPAANAQAKAPEKAPRQIPFNLSLFGPVGFAQVFDEPVVALSSLNLISGSIDGIHGVEVGTVYNHVEATMTGFQAVAGVNVVGKRVTGMQAAGLGNVSGSLTGLQAAGGFNVAGHVKGVQAGVINVAGTVKGAQAGVINVAGTVKGAQAAVINKADTVKGLQVGVLNTGGTMTGMQIGVLNVADDFTQGAPIGVFSYVRNGRFEGDLQVTDSGFTTLGVNSGTQRVYSILGLSNLPKADGNHLGLNVGIGVQFPLSQSTFSRLELTGGPLQDTPSSVANWTSVNTLKGMLGWKIAPRLALKAGVSLNYATLREGSTFRPSENVIYESGRTQFWPAAFIGVDL